MMASYDPIPTVASRWTLRTAVFSAMLILSALLAHRLAGMATPVALTLVAAGLAGAAAALLLAGLAVAQFWRRPALGAAHVVVGTTIAVAIFAWPVVYLPAYVQFPALAEVSTDLGDPPAFAAVAAARTPPANSPHHPGGEAAALQREFYPDLKTFTLDRSAEDAFQIARDAVQRLRYKVVFDEPPADGRGEVEGLIEALDRTMIVGFYDDVVIRIRGNARRSRIDVRSASRYGRHDLGRNAQRARTILKEIQARLEASVPGAPAARPSRLKERPDARPVPKRGRDGDPEKSDRPRGRAPDR